MSEITGKFKIDNTPVLDPQLGSKFELNPTGVWYRNMNADRCGYLVANMKKLYWIYNGISKSELNTILNIIYSKLNSGSDIFTVESDVVGLGQVTDQYYIGAPFNPGELIGPDLYKLEIHWIQTKGKKTIK